MFKPNVYKTANVAHCALGEVAHEKGILDIIIKKKVKIRQAFLSK